MAVRAAPLVVRVLECLRCEARDYGHDLVDFERFQGDSYVSECIDCGADATVICSSRKYEKFGGAFRKRCEAGILPGMSNLIVAGEELSPPDGLVIENYKMAGIVHFKNAARVRKPVTEVILHETVTSSSRATVDVLTQRGLGVHLIVGPDGIIRQHGDLSEDELWHASSHNGPSVGIEVVNPYYPKYRPSNSPWTQVIDAPWAHEGKYVVPTFEQAEATCGLVSWLCGSNSDQIQIPRIWVGLKEKKLALGRIAGADVPSPGIYAHYYFGHADGAWLVLYCLLRMEAELEAAEAYAEATLRTTGKTGSVDLSDLLGDT